MNMPQKRLDVEEPYALIAPDADVAAYVKNFDFLAVDPDSKVTAFHGFSTFRGLKIESKGFDVEGTISGRVRSYNWTALYQVYNLPSSSSWSLWALKFKADKSQSVLKQTFHEEDLEDLAVNMKFRAKANDLGGVTFLRVGFETIKLRLEGVEKNFTVVNPASGGARDEDGNEIPVDFEPI
ncbi:hypothetical protein [Streptomyces lanatus]|uniref:Uncharacterized protein n=1 Tax=Streptomyces lanatus TaxID=66900 RepID=A0ABV1XQU0_9ACTN|nr:hypothetical protein [Streptomyces lanatus]GHG89060.1 hypothetical protein GCM10018780_07980 [Streptomyces lanatus]